MEDLSGEATSWNNKPDIYENYNDEMQYRSNALNARSSSVAEVEEGSQQRNGKDRSSTLFSKSEIDVVTFEDFNIKSIVGKGTFGKVYLVQNTKN